MHSFCKFKHFLEGICLECSLWMVVLSSNYVHGIWKSHSYRPPQEWRHSGYCWGPIPWDVYRNTCMNHLCSNTVHQHTESHPDTHLCLQKNPKANTFNGIIIKSCQLLFLKIDQCIHTYKINYLAINNSLAKTQSYQPTPFHFILLKIALIHYLI